MIADEKNTVQQELVSGGVSLKLNLNRFRHPLPDDRDPRKPRLRPENQSLVNYPGFPVVSTMTLRFDKDRIEQGLRSIAIAVAEASHIDYEWPSNVGEATLLASRDMLAVIWDTPEEDEAWRDL